MISTHDFQVPGIFCGYFQVLLEIKRKRQKVVTHSRPRPSFGPCTDQVGMRDLKIDGIYWCDLTVYPTGSKWSGTGVHCIHWRHQSNAWCNLLVHYVLPDAFDSRPWQLVWSSRECNNGLARCQRFRKAPKGNFIWWALYEARVTFYKTHVKTLNVPYTISRYCAKKKGGRDSRLAGVGWLRDY